MKYLFLYRHADTLPQQDGQTDHDRALSPQGEAESTRAGLFLKESALLPEKALCSTAIRARATLGLTAQAAETLIQADFANKLYLANPGDILKQIQDVEGNPSSVMVVGHNPGLHQLCLTLAQSGEQNALTFLAHRFPPATLAVFKLELASWEDLSPTTPAELVKLFMP